MRQIVFFLFFAASLFAQKPYLVMVADPGCPVCLETAKMIRGDKELRETILEYTDFQIVSKKEAVDAGLIVNTTPTFYFFAKEKRALLVPELEGKPIDAHEFSLFIKEVYRKYNANFDSGKPSPDKHTLNQSGVK